MYKSVVNQREGDCCRSNDQIIHKTTAFSLSSRQYDRFSFLLLNRLQIQCSRRQSNLIPKYQRNEMMCFFLVRQTKKALKIASLQWLQASERTGMFVGRCRELQTYQNNAKIIMCWCRATEAEAQPKNQKPKPKLNMNIA